MATVWHITYSARASDLCRGTKSAHMMDSLHMLRDGNSFNYLSACVASEYSECGLILNLPPGVYRKNGPGFGPLPPINKGDLLVLATRPPIEDDGEHDRRSIAISESELEKAIFKELEKVFEYCSRQIVLLSESFAGALDKSARKYASVQFNIKKNAFYNRLSAVRAGDMGRRLHRLGKIKSKKYEKTLGYLIYIPEVPFGDGPSLLISFGMNGTSNLLWNFSVKTHLCNEVRAIIRAGRPHILVGEFSLNLPNDQRPTYISPDLVSIPEKVIDMDFELR